MTVLDHTYNFASLSLKDVLDARDLYHFHLLSKANVLGTAVGLYLIRKDEDWPKKKGEGAVRHKKKTYARTLFNSEVRDYSWPCVLAFVREWQPEEAFGPDGAYNPAQIVPRTLYMPDGRAVPVCVVEAKELAPAGRDRAAVGLIPPSFRLGGGLPIEVAVQGQTHLATAGCLVSDGHLTYAMTARHACGPAGTAVYSRLRHGRVQIGASSDHQLTRLPFSEVYPDYPGRRSFASLDVGLVRLDDVGEWTSNTYGLPPVGPMADVNEVNLTVRLIDQPVVAFGAASGLLRGHIKALFYRHRSVGGYDYVGDFLISPVEGTATRHGDSGTVWHLDVTEDKAGHPPKPLAKRDLRPLAIEWGGQVFDEAGKRSAFAVATALSNVCRLLDVELVSDQSRGVSGYWGRTGHYSIATLAIDLVGDARLKSFLEKNSHLLSFDADAIEKDGFDKAVGQLGPSNKFVPLADVPDEIWKKLSFGSKAIEGGRDTTPGPHGSDGPEHPNHYADVDFPFGPNGETWLALCLADPANVSPEAWLDFYRRMADKLDAAGLAEEARRARLPNKQGLLPFRIWQFFDAMQRSVRAGDPTAYLTAAGTVAHYVGDACQPLHGSILSDGDPSRTVERHHPRTGETETVTYGKGVHGAYETAMLSANATDLLRRIAEKLPSNGKHGLPLASNGKAMAIATLKLMGDVAAILPPQRILEVFETSGAGRGAATLGPMWEEFADPTAEVMALGARTLAMLWEATWSLGNGAAIPATKLKALGEDAVRTLYIDKSFVPSVTLDKIKPFLS